LPAILSDLPDAVLFRNFLSPFYYTGMLPSVWMWLYIGAASVAGALVKSEKPIKRIIWALDVEKSPIRSVGVIAGAMVFVAAFILALFAGFE
jgi:hypothetical protein